MWHRKSLFLLSLLFDSSIGCTQWCSRFIRNCPTEWTTQFYNHWRAQQEWSLLCTHVWHKKLCVLKQDSRIRTLINVENFFYGIHDKSCNENKILVIVNVQISENGTFPFSLFRITKTRIRKFSVLSLTDRDAGGALARNKLVDHRPSQPRPKLLADMIPEFIITVIINETSCLVILRMLAS